MDLIHKQHKYIAKQKTGNKTRYFYTQEELAAYKRALSSRDEKAAYENSQNKAKAAIKNYEDVSYKNMHKTVLALPGKKKNEAQAEIDNAKKEANKAIAEKDANKEKYEKSQTLKGKVEDVKKVNAQVKERKAEEKAAKKADRKEEIKGYAKALTTSDEKKKYFEKDKKMYEELDNFKEKKAEFKEVEATSLNPKKRKEARAEMEKAAADFEKAKAEQKKADQEWEKAENTSKAEAVKEVFNKHHPDTVKRVNKAKKKIKKYLGN